MSSLNTSNPVALGLLITDDIYYLPKEVIEIPDEQHCEKVVEPITDLIFNYLGENNKYILILNYDDKAEFMAEKELDAFKSILQAMKMELRDVAIFNLYRYPTVSYAQLKKFFSCNKIVLFGINPAVLGINNISSNQISSVEGVRMLASFSLSEMLNDVSKKRIFWNEMKQL